MVQIRHVDQEILTKTLKPDTKGTELSTLPVYADEEKIEITNLFAKKFIARSDIKAIQRSNGDYNPVPSKFTRGDLLDHLDGIHTYGHYLLSENNQAKLFVFDLDLDKTDPKHPEITYDLPASKNDVGIWDNWYHGDPRAIWLDRSKVIERDFLKYQLRMSAHMICKAIQDELGIESTVTYTGAKGVHVYGFTGSMQASAVREAADIIIESMRLVPEKGNNFFKFPDESRMGDLFFPSSITVEVFPKQITLDGKTHGNLCRLPLGVNLKNPNDPTFFMDMRSNFGEGSFTPRNALEALTTKNVWA
jgi:hypothetical protein